MLQDTRKFEVQSRGDSTSGECGHQLALLDVESGGRGDSTSGECRHQLALLDVESGGILVRGVRVAGEGIPHRVSVGISSLSVES